MTISAPKKRTLALAAIKPYENNPRRIPTEAVAKVRESIEKYGYVQPIVVDADNVVVVGHTRLAALQEMGVDKVDVYVFEGSQEKANEYRLVDNRTGEMSDWDQSALSVELREWEASLLESFFPEIDLEIGTLTSAMKDITEKDVEDATTKAQTVRALQPAQTTKVVCPSCYHTFEVKTASLPGISEMDLEIIGAANRGGAEG